MTGKRPFGFGIALIVCGVMACEGPTGPQGEQGPQGEAGNANVVADTLTLTNGDWISNSIFWLDTSPNSSTGFISRYVDLNIPAITEEILYAGEIRVYMENSPISAPGSLTPLPVVFIVSDYSRNYFYETSVGKIRLHYFHRPNYAGATLPNPADETIPTRLYKWVVIEGTLASQMMAEGVDLDVQDDVSQFLSARGIPVQTGAAGPPAR
ncbi:MAG: hypothetical protein ACN0LA_13495 [Candidatus Longimicrobiales bacterium M2_2A_002]